MATFLKDPDARLDYRADWAADGWLAEGEEITSSTWIVPDGIVMDDDDHDATTATVWLTGGTAGQTYQITNRIQTNQDRIDDRSLKIAVTQR